jgi:hypothetical protein
MFWAHDAAPRRYRPITARRLRRGNCVDSPLSFCPEVSLGVEVLFRTRSRKSFLRGVVALREYTHLEDAAPD